MCQISEREAGNDFAPTRGRDRVYIRAIAWESRLGCVKRQVSRTFIANNGQKLATGKFLPRCYPRVKRSEGLWGG